MLKWGMSVCCALLINGCAQTPTPAPASQVNTWNPSYDNGDILDFIQLVQTATGKTFVVDPRVQGEVTIVNSVPLTTEALYKLFLATLDVNGYTAVEIDNIVRVIPKPVTSAPVDSPTN